VPSALATALEHESAPSHPGIEHLRPSRITEAVSTSLDRELAEGETNPYDTHPPLRGRIAAVQSLPDRETPGPDLPAISLLGDGEGLETHFIGAPWHEPTAQTLPLVAWEGTGWKIWAPPWEDYVGKYAKVLARTTPHTLADLSQSLEALSHRLRESDGEDLAPEECRQQATATLGIALAVALSRSGWKLQILPGDDVHSERKEAIIKPFDIVAKPAPGELTPEAWQGLSVGHGIADLDLGGGTVTIQEASSNEPA
jgi:heat shock protein HtpX